MLTNWFLRLQSLRKSQLQRSDEIKEHAIGPAEAQLHLILATPSSLAWVLSVVLLEHVTGVEKHLEALIHSSSGQPESLLLNLGIR